MPRDTVRERGCDSSQRIPASLLGMLCAGNVEIKKRFGNNYLFDGEHKNAGLFSH
jgi:hypothetical protein